MYFIENIPKHFDCQTAGLGALVAQLSEHAFVALGTLRIGKK